MLRASELASLLAAGAICRTMCEKEDAMYVKAPNWPYVAWWEQNPSGIGSREGATRPGKTAAGRAGAARVACTVCGMKEGIGDRGTTVASSILRSKLHPRRRDRCCVSISHGSARRREYSRVTAWARGCRSPGACSNCGKGCSCDEWLARWKSSVSHPRVLSVASAPCTLPSRGYHLQ